jgi:hypothetical protein
MEDDVLKKLAIQYFPRFGKIAVHLGFVTAILHSIFIKAAATAAHTATSRHLQSKIENPFIRISERGMMQIIR